MKKILAIVTAITLVLTAVCGVFGLASAAETSYTAPTTFELYDFFADAEACRAAGTAISSDSPWSYQAKPENGEWSSWVTGTSVDGSWYYWLNGNKGWGNYPGFAYYYPADQSGRYWMTYISPMNSANSNEWRIDSAYAFTAPVNGIYTFGQCNQDKVISWDAANYFAQADAGEALDFGVRITKNGETIWNGDDTAEKRDGFAVFGTKTAASTMVAVPTINSIALHKGDVLRVEITLFDGISASPWTARVNGTPAVTLTQLTAPDPVAGDVFELYDYFEDVEASRLAGTAVSSDSAWTFQAKDKANGQDWTGNWLDRFSHGTDEYTYAWSSAREWGMYPGVMYNYPTDQSGRYYFTQISPTKSGWGAGWEVDTAYAFTAPVAGTYTLGKANQDKVNYFDLANWFSQHDTHEALDFGVRITVNGNKIIWNGDSTAMKRDGFAVFGTKTATTNRLEVPTVSGIELNAGDVLRVEFTAFDGAMDSYSQRINGTVAVTLNTVKTVTTAPTAPVSYELYDFYEDIDAARLNSTAYVSDAAWSIQGKRPGSDWEAWGNSTIRDSGYTYFRDSAKEWGNFPGVTFYKPDDYAGGRLWIGNIAPTNSANDASWEIDMAYAFTAPHDGYYTLGKANQDMVLSFADANSFFQYNKDEKINFGVRITKNGTTTLWNGDANAEKQDGFAVFGTNGAAVQSIDVPTVSDIALQAGDVVRVEFTSFTPISGNPWAQRIQGLVGMTYTAPMTTTVADATSATLAEAVGADKVVRLGAGKAMKDWNFTATNKSVSFSVFEADVNEELQVSMGCFVLRLFGANSYLYRGYNGEETYRNYDLPAPVDGKYDITMKQQAINAGSDMVGMRVTVTVNGVTFTEEYDMTENYTGFGVHNSGSKTIYFAADATEEFDPYMGSSITLSSQIDANFYVDETDETQLGTMAFTVNGNPVEAVRSFNDKAGKYFYSCPVNSLEMAEEIVATYMLDGKEYVKKSSVKQYLDTIIANADAAYSDEAVMLAKKTSNYGFYAQNYLAGLHSDVVIGEDGYAAMSAYEDADINVEAAKAALGDGKATVANADDNTVLYGRSLYLESKTALNFYVRVKDGSGIVGNVTCDGKDVTVTEKGNNVYLITVADIDAEDYATKYTVTVNGVSFTSSVLDYCAANLAKNASGNAANTMAALYEYYTAAVAYAASK